MAFVKEDFEFWLRTRLNDLRGQIDNLVIPRPLKKLLTRHLDRTLHQLEDKLNDS